MSDWFTKKGYYYDADGNIKSVSGALIQQSTPHARLHMAGKLDQISDEQKNLIQSVQTHNLLHNSAVAKEKVNGYSLPPGKSSVNECSAQECKRMLVARGCNVTGKGRPLSS